MRFALALLLTGCYPALFVADRFSQPQPVYTPAPQIDPRDAEIAAWEARRLKRIEDDRAADAAKAQADEEAAKQREQDLRTEAISDARKDGLCKPTDEEKVCLRAHFLREDIATACALLDDVRRYQADVAYQWREGRKYGVVDLQEIDRSKSHAQAKEDDLADVAEKIKAARGKSFSPKKDC